MTNDKDEGKSPKQEHNALPTIRVDADVRDDEPHITIGKRKASLAPPIPFNPREK